MCRRLHSPHMVPSSTRDRWTHPPGPPTPYACSMAFWDRSTAPALLSGDGERRRKEKMRLPSVPSLLHRETTKCRASHPGPCLVLGAGSWSSHCQRLSWITGGDRDEMSNLVLETLSTQSATVVLCTWGCDRKGGVGQERKACVMGTKLNYKHPTPGVTEEQPSTEDYRSRLSGECFQDLVCPEKCRCEGTVVDCSNLKLTKLPPHIPEHTTDLNLSNNKLRDIREGAFDGAGGVLEMLLTGNKLQALQGRMFRGLTGLKTLMLRSNQLGCVDNTTFTGLSSVRLLSLYDNRISTIAPGAFTTLHSLSTM
ncbi:unnamed protein product [Coregonus sp. 'balchen']|nr:unnamed protein product [Coregonus sp. 'balchen']